MLRIFSLELKVILRSLRPIAILSLCSKTISYTITTDNFVNSQVKTCYAYVKAAKQVRLKSKMAIFVTVISAARCPLRFQANIDLVQCQLSPANGILEFMGNIRYSILLTSLPGQQAHVPKHTIAGKLCKNLTTLVDLSQMPSIPTE